MTNLHNLYEEGLKPLLYSVTDESLNGVGWRRSGDHITYFPNRDLNKVHLQTFTLTFTIQFSYDDDTVYFAYCYPYTYSDLQEYLLTVCSHPITSAYTKLDVLCKSLAARVHPSETPSSWIMKGVLDFLTGDSSIAVRLREMFIFYVVPMLNPDGVIVGNSRFSLHGKDLNRQFKSATEKSCSSIWHIKSLVERLLTKYEIAMYCDFHAHSRKHNIFMYGCSYDNPNVQLFPMMLHRIAPELFSYEDSEFNVHEIKEGTARVVMWMIGITNSFTLEASIGGSLLNYRTGTHFSVQDYEQMGHHICNTIFSYFGLSASTYRYMTNRMIMYLTIAIFIVPMIFILMLLVVFNKN